SEAEHAHAQRLDGLKDIKSHSLKGTTTFIGDIKRAQRRSNLGEDNSEYGQPGDSGNNLAATISSLTRL
ncbi:MAG: hypothetical protein ACRDF4_09740, partial [Rhabdochlamydiaceae bacterium]